MNNVRMFLAAPIIVAIFIMKIITVLLIAPVMLIFAILYLLLWLLVGKEQMLKHADVTLEIKDKK